MKEMEKQTGIVNQKIERKMSRTEPSANANSRKKSRYHTLFGWRKVGHLVT